YYPGYGYSYPGYGYSTYGYPYDYSAYYGWPSYYGGPSYRAAPAYSDPTSGGALIRPARGRKLVHVVAIDSHGRATYRRAHSGVVANVGAEIAVSVTNVAASRSQRCRSTTRRGSVASAVP